MKKMRVILSLILSFLMIFSSVGIMAEETAEAPASAASTFSDISGGTKLSEAVEKLVAYGIITGYEDGTFRPDGSITRAEASAVIARFEGIATNLPVDAVTGFKDLDEDSSSAWARPYVKACVDAGIINGFDDGTFRAKETVTYEQIIKMVLCAIDYAGVAESEKLKLEALGNATTWSSGFIMAANKFGITQGAVMADVTKPASRGTVAFLVSNAYKAPIMVPVKDKEGNVNYEIGSGTIEEEGRDKLVEIDGYVSGNYYTSLASQAPGIGKNELLITVNGVERTYKMSDMLSGNVDVADLLGKQIKAFYSEMDREITRITESNLNQSLIVKEQDTKNITDTEFKYTNANGNAKTESLTGYTFIYNGKYMPSMVGSDLESGTYEFVSGEIEFLTNNYVKLAKITNYFVGVVKSYSRTDNKVNLRFGKTYDGNSYYQFESSTYARPEIYVDGKLTDLDSLTLSSYNVLNILKSPTGTSGNIINKVYVTKKAYSGRGEVTSRSNTSRKVGLDGEDIYLTVDYDNYSGGSEEQKAPFEIGQTYNNIYLDYTGQIAAVNYSATSMGSYNYGYLLFAGENRERTGYAIRIINESGTDTVLNVKSTLKVDGQRVACENLASTLLTKIASADTTAFTNDGATNILHHQPIRYSVSGDNEVTSIDTMVSAGGEGDSFTRAIKYSDGSSTVKSAGSTLEQSGTSFRVDSNTKILFVPDNRVAYNDYASLSRSKAFPASETVKVEAFDLNENSVAAYVLVYGTDPNLRFTNSSPYMIVTGKYVYNGQIHLLGYVNGSTGEPKDVKVSVDGYKSSVAESSANNADEGDVIRYITNSSGEIISVMIWYDASSPVQEVDFANYSFDEDHNSVRRLQKSSDKSGAYFFMYGTPVSYIEDINATSGNVVDIVLEMSYVVPTDTTSGDTWKTTPDLEIKCLRSNKLVPVYELTSEGVQWVETDSLEIDDASEASPNRLIVIYDGTVTRTAKAIYIIK